jgi:hypothetical protein
MNIRFKINHFRFTPGKKFYVPVTEGTLASGDEPLVPIVRAEGADNGRDGVAPLRGQSKGAFFNRKSQIANRQSESGIALVITLILLSVTLVMAIAFLAISRRERGSVSTKTDTTVAKNASETALAQATAQIVAQVYATQNPYIESLIVSTNYINAAGFTNSTMNATGWSNLANVNFDHLAVSGNSLAPQDFIQNCANLFYSPRVPVFYSNDFRFYLDLNRNGRYDTNGLVEEVDNAGNPIINSFGTTNYSVQVGDPEWIGVLEHPDAPHSANNPFIARYCFIAVPADTLDLNHIHNQVLDLIYSGGSMPTDPNTSGRDAYYRNQDVGTWEINLAAFLADLNTNRWDPPTKWNNLLEPYQYPEGADGSSAAFDNARDLVSWRYNYFYTNLATADNLFGGLGSLGDLAFRNSGVDAYTVAPVQTVFDTNYAGYNNPTLPWVGADNTNDYFGSPSDLFNPGKTSTQFTNNLIAAGTNLSTYDRYTFYRLLSQLGTDSTPESGLLNINYSNAIVNYDSVGIPTSITIVPGAETNFVSWNPTNFFAAAADKLLNAYTAEWYESSPSNYVQNYYGLSLPWLTNAYNISGIGITNIQRYGQTNQIPSFGLTNIPVLVNNTFVYTPAVNRLLQLAANIYDATTNNQNLADGNSNYPSVFRPIFWKTNEYSAIFNQYFTNIYIRGYRYVTEPIKELADNPNTIQIFSLPTELNDPNVPFGVVDISTNFYGVPWIIGAKKGFPNFNGLEIQNCFFIERLLQFNRSTTVGFGETFPYGRVYTTNQMYIMGVSNIYGVADWNSYNSNYFNNVTVVARDTFSFGMSNDANGYVTVTSTNYTVGYPQFGSWPGKAYTAASYVLPLGTNVLYQDLSPPSLNVYSPNNAYVYCYGPAAETLSGITFHPPCWIPTFLDPSNFLDSGTPPLPHLVMQTTNRLQAYILDNRPKGVYILDYVQLGGMNNSLDLNQAVADNSFDPIQYPNNNEGLWSTNYYQGSTPYGINEQYMVSLGSQGVPQIDQDGGNWTTTPVPGTIDTGPAAQQAFFSAFFSPNNRASFSGAKLGYVVNTVTNMQAPFSPTRLAVQRFVYVANDPLVHYMTSDLYDFPDGTNFQLHLDSSVLGILTTFPGDRYMPWSRSGNLAGTIVGGVTPDGNAFNLSYKDPLVYSSDNWDFPTNKFPTVGFLGRVHRGTPWQSVYLKSSNILSYNLVIPHGYTGNAGLPTWQAWTGNLNADDAFNTAPIQDRLLFDLFTATVDENATRGQLSVNVEANDTNNPLAGLASWSALLSGTVAFSNNTPDFVVPYRHAYESPDYGQVQPNYTVWTNQPIGSPPYVGNSVNPTPSITNVPMWKIVQSINNARTNMVSIDGLQGVFEHVGDVLSAPALSDASPFLNSADSVQQQYGISDEMYEWMPQQILPLLTVSGTPQSPPRYVIYCYGQSLKPAPNGEVQSGPFFGLCTNYQVVAESASRAIIRVDNAPTPANPTATPHIVVEQFNPLPPD